MPLESASTVNDLNPENPKSNDPPGQGDDHIRTIKLVMKNTLGSLDGNFSKTAEAIENPFPVGMITLWSGSVASIPTGWKLCDGNNGTPNLRDRFVMGAGGGKNPGTTGGSSTHSHAGTAVSAGGHSHSVTVNSHTLTVNQIPSHTHDHVLTSENATKSVLGQTADILSSSTSMRVPKGDGSKATTLSIKNTGGGQGHNHGASSNTTGAHTHSVTTSGIDHSPRYYALAFIMKV